MKNLQFIYQKKSISRLVIFLLVINSFMFTDAWFNQSYAAPAINEMNINATDNEVSVYGTGDGNGTALAEKPFRYTIGSSQSDWVRDASNMTITDTLTAGTLSNTSVVNNALQLSTVGGVFLNGYSYKSVITIDHTKIDASLTNFPLTVYLNSSNFDFSKAKADGTDICFTDVNLNLLKFEREEHSTANAKAVYNVLIPSVSNTTDTQIYIWYGNPNAYNTSIEAWQDQTGKPLIYNGNVSIKKANGLTTNLYYAGDVYTSITGGWLSSVDSSRATITYGTSSVIMDANYESTGGAYQANMATANTINTVGYTLLKATIKRTSTTSTPANYPTVLKLSNGTAYNSTAITSTTCTTVGTTTTITLDVSAYQGNYNVSLYAYGNEVEITRIWLDGTNANGAYFDGTGDYIDLGTSPDMVLGSNDFTIELTIKPNLINSTFQRLISSTISAFNNNSLCIRIESTNNITAYGGGVVLRSTTILNPGTTYNIALSKIGTTAYLFINGVLEAQGTYTVNNFAEVLRYIGGYYTLANNEYFNGYILKSRITNGRGRYNANFTPPTSFSIDGSDVVFCTNFDTIYDQNYSMVQHMGDSLVDATGNANNGTATGTTVVNTEYGKARSFDGIDDRITNMGFGIGADPLFTIITNWQGITNKSSVSLWGLGGGNTGNGIESYAGGIGNIGIDLWGSSTYEITPDYLAKNCTAWIKNNTGVFNNTKFKIFNNSILQQPVQTRYNGATPSLINGISIGNASANYSDAYSNAVVSEFRASNIARSDAWIKAESLSLKNELITIGNYPLFGTRESVIYDVSGSISSSRIQWSESKPTGTNIIVESNVSIDGGSSWLGWKSCTNGDAIPDLTSANSSNARLKLRQTLSSSSGTATPSLSNSVITVNFSKYVHHISATPNKEYTVKFEIKDTNGSVTSNTRKVYTKAQAPLFTISGATDHSVDLLFSDTNPATTEYQIMCDSSYINSSGVLTSVPTWITLKNKSITILGLNIGTMYNFTAKARNAAEEETNYASPIYTGTQGVPVPTGSAILAATALNNSVTLGWDEIPNSLSYELELDGVIKNVGLNTSYIHKDLMTSTQHVYRVRGRNQEGFSDWSNLVTITTTNNLPLIPTNVVAKASKDTVTVYWSSAQDALTYTVEIDGTEVADVLKNSASLFGLQQETAYTYRVKACNLAGDSEWSETGTITTTFLSTPRINFKEKDSNQLTIGWEKIEGATSYQIALDANESFRTLYASDLEEFATGSSITFTHDNLPIKTAHVYRIRAVCPEGASAWSDAVTLETLAQRPDVPSNFRGKCSDNFITLTWNAIEEAIGYDLEVDGVVIENDNTPQYQYKGLDQYTEHTYRVRSVTKEIQSYWSNLLKLWTSGGVPAEPKNVVITNSRGITTLDWDPAPGAQNYDIEADGNIYSISEDTFVYNNINLIASSSSIYKETAYRLRAGNDLGKSDWTGYYVNNAIMSKVEKGKELDLGLTASNIMDFSRYTLYVNYNDKALTVTDLCAYSVEKELGPGMVEGHDIEIVSFSPGRIVFRVNKIIDEGYLWTGIINNIKFVGNATGGSTITYTAQCSKD